MTGDRGLSTPLAYALIVAITVVLTAGLVVGAETFIDQNREETAVQQIDVVGEQLGATLVHADQLAATEPAPDRVNVMRRFPERVAGSQYQISLTSDTDAPRNRTVVTLEALDFDTTVRTNVTTNLRVGPADEPVRINGGRLEVAYNATGNRLEVYHV